VLCIASTGRIDLVMGDLTDLPDVGRSGTALRSRRLPAEAAGRRRIFDPLAKSVGALGCARRSCAMRPAAHC
jgi:hypothetical protein